jgi:phosphoribosylamine--glycine ligase
MASKGYPEKYETGFEISIYKGFEGELYVAGAKMEGGKLLTAGGRVLGVVATADTLGEAVEKAYKNAEKVHFANAFMRSDIGKRALEA